MIARILRSFGTWLILCALVGVGVNRWLGIQWDTDERNGIFG